MQGACLHEANPHPGIRTWILTTGHSTRPHFTAKALASWQSLAAVIDHTLLKPDATRKQVETLCDEAVRYRFACVMVNPVWASTAVARFPARAFR